MSNTSLLRNYCLLFIRQTLNPSAFVGNMQVIDIENETLYLNRPTRLLGPCSDGIMYFYTREVSANPKVPKQKNRNVYNILGKHDTASKTI